MNRGWTILIDNIIVWGENDIWSADHECQGIVSRGNKYLIIFLPSGNPENMHKCQYGASPKKILWCEQWI